MMGRNADIPMVRGLMLDFAERTGLSSSGSAPRRYLWTDAHAVCNFLSLYRASGDHNYLELCLALVEQVHDVLGRHRADDRRSGWISGLPEAEGRAHPTAGGLRIGKPLPERAPDDPYDERLEWDRDGQYFHYLTKWMHALARVAAVSGNPRYCRYAIELARVAQARFATPSGAGGPSRLYWKMSIDLSRPLVPSTGVHDPLDAYVTLNELAASAGRFEDAELPVVDAEIDAARGMLEGRYWHTDDPLGIGGLLFDLCRVAQLAHSAVTGVADIAPRLAQAAAESVEFYVAHADTAQPADYRLAFRELGLSIGLHALSLLRSVQSGMPTVVAEPMAHSIAVLERYAWLAEAIEAFWCDSSNRRGYTWRDHEDINAVMLATSLLPDEFLAI